MTTDINTLTFDMLKFATLLRVIQLPELAQNYESRALWLRWSDPASEDIEETRSWVRLTLKGGAGGLGDRYVHKRDGSVDDELNQEYWELLGKMTDFANGGEAPASDLIQQMGNDMFTHGYTYVRKIQVPVQKWWFTRMVTMYEVMTAPGVIEVVEPKYLGRPTRYDPNGSRRDMQECQMQAHKLYSEGRSDDWVHFSSSQIVSGELLRNAE